MVRHKLPSIIFPLPNSIYNHQYYNAKFLLDKKACILLDESNFNLNNYAESLNKLIIEKKYFENMQESINNIILPCHEVIEDFISLIALRSLMPVLLMEISYRYEKIVIPEKSY